MSEEYWKECPYCTATIKKHARVCQHCGYTVDEQLKQQQHYESGGVSRTGFILLGLFLGGLGIHNFYAGFTGRGIAQLLITICSCGWLWFVVFIWNIIEICIVDVDASGRRMT